jgi:hypothetical protein
MSGEAAAHTTRARVSRILRGILFALLLSFVIGMLIGTVIRHRIEGPPIRYIGAIQAESSIGNLSASSPGPLHVA